MKTTNRLATISFLALSTLTGASCVSELGDADDALTDGVPQDGAAPDDITQETSELFYAGFWTDEPSSPSPTRSRDAVAMARNFDKTYTWYRDGLVCRGTNTVTCADGYWNFSAPDSNKWKAIRATAFEPYSNRVYTWYEDATYTVGVPTNLTSVAEKKSIKMPTFTFLGVPNYPMDMGMLVDAYCKSNFSAVLSPTTPPTCVFYWQVGVTSAETTVIWRTVGTPGNPASESGAKQVTNTRTHGDIIGIDMNYDNGKVYTWYADGRINMSTDSLNLAQ
jgi:hypothetical protein